MCWAFWMQEAPRSHAPLNDCRHHFWFLEVVLAAGTVSLQRLCVGICLAFLPALIVPGFLMTASLLQLVGPFLIGQVTLPDTL